MRVKSAGRLNRSTISGLSSWLESVIAPLTGRQRSHVGCRSPLSVEPRRFSRVKLADLAMIVVSIFALVFCLSRAGIELQEHGFTARLKVPR